MARLLQSLPLFRSMLPSLYHKSRFTCSSSMATLSLAKLPWISSSSSKVFDSRRGLDLWVRVRAPARRFARVVGTSRHPQEGIGKKRPTKGISSNPKHGKAKPKPKPKAKAEAGVNGLQEEELDGELFDEDEEFLDDDGDLEEDYPLEEDEEEEIQIGDGGDGGGLVFGSSTWAKTALELAEETLRELGSDFSIYAFKVVIDGRIFVRLDKLTDKYGSPTMKDIEGFSSIYGKKLEEAGQSGLIPDKLALQVSSPGAERVVQIPQDLLRFKDLPMYVRYMETVEEGDGKVAPEKDGVFELVSVDTELGNCVWKIANVRLNRELAGKGRTLNRKQRDWRAETPFSSLRFVRLYLDA